MAVDRNVIHYFFVVYPPAQSLSERLGDFVSKGPFISRNCYKTMWDASHMFMFHGMKGIPQAHLALGDAGG